MSFHRSLRAYRRVKRVDRSVIYQSRLQLIIYSSKLQEPLDTLLSLNSRPVESIVNQSFHQMLLLSYNRALQIVVLCLFVSKLLALAFIVCSTYSCVPQVTFRGKEGKLLTWLDYKAKEASCNTKAVGKGDLSYIYIYR